MGARSRRALALDLLTWIVAAAALALVVRERVLPWIAERGIVDPGDRVGAELSVLDTATGDSIPLARDSSTLVFVFRSTCAACTRSVPAWARLAREAGVRAIAVGLESARAAARYARAHLPAARPAVPTDARRFARQLRIRVVPTTLLIDREGRLAERRVGPLEESDVTELRRLLAPSVP